MLSWNEIEKSQREARRARKLEKQRELDSFDEDVEILGIKKKIWKEYKEKIMNKTYEQDELPNFAEAQARAREAEIPEMQRLKHLAHWGLKFEKYASFSKDPEFKKRCMQRRSMCFNMMDPRGR